MSDVNETAVARRSANLLIVDDDDVDQMAMQRALKRQKIGNPFFTARDGLEALEMLRSGRVPSPYIILLDLKMPRMSGLEFLQALRREPAHHQAIVFVLTTSKDEQDKLSAYDQHVAGYIVKSNVSNEFLEVIRLLDCYWRIVEIPVTEAAACMSV